MVINRLLNNEDMCKPKMNAKNKKARMNLVPIERS